MPWHTAGVCQRWHSLVLLLAPSPWDPLVLPFLYCVPLGLLLRQGSHQSLPKTDEAEVSAQTAPDSSAASCIKIGQTHACLKQAFCPHLP